MRARTREKRFDALISRVLFFELAVFAIFLLWLFLPTSSASSTLIAIILSIGAAIIGLCLYACFVLEDNKVIRWANNTGNHELMFAFALLAMGISEVVRRLRDDK